MYKAVYRVAECTPLSMSFSTGTNLKKSRLRTTISNFGPTLIKLFDNVLLDSKSKENIDQRGEEKRKEKPAIAMSQSVPVKLCEGGRGTEDQRGRGTAQIILDGDSEAVRRRPGAAALRRRRDEITHEQQQRLDFTSLLINLENESSSVHSVISSVLSEEHGK